jgi:hypothetical protein
MTLTILDGLEQGSEEWHAARRGVFTASVAGRLITPKTVQVASNADTRTITLQLVAERLTGNTDPTYASAEMDRGHYDEPVARDLYSEHFAPARECGFMVRDDWGFKIGYSPDGLVGDDGLIEIKSRDQKTHLATILADKIPDANVAQLQCGLLVSGRDWIDYVSYCSGMPLYRKRVQADPRWHTAIVDAATAFEAAAADITARYREATIGLPETEREALATELRL